DVLRERNWTDWREFRFKSHTDGDVAEAISRLAKTIRSSVREIEPMIAAARSQQKATVKAVSQHALSNPEDKTESAASSNKDQYEVPEIALNAKLEKSHYEKVTESYEYYTFTTKFDEVISARVLSDEAELLRLYGYLAKISEGFDIEGTWK